MQLVTVTLKVYLPDEVIDSGPAGIECYLNDKLYQDPEFYGEIDQGCFEITGEREPN